MRSPKDYPDEARDAETGAPRLAELAALEWEFVRAAVAAHPRATSALLVQLTPRGDRLIDEAIARRPEAPVESLRTLAARFGRMANASGRAVGFDLGLALLCNAATPMDAIEALLDPTRTTPHFRTKVAGTQCRRDVLLKLWCDVSERVRKRAAAAHK